LFDITFCGVIEVCCRLSFVYYRIYCIKDFDFGWCFTLDGVEKVAM